MGETILEFEVYRQNTTVYFTISHQEDDYINISYQGNLTVIPNLVGLFLGKTAFGMLNGNSNPNNTTVFRTFDSTSSAETYMTDLKQTLHDMSVKIMRKYKVFRSGKAKDFGYRCNRKNNKYWMYIINNKNGDPRITKWGL